jgi:hypothetical protein
MPKGNIDSESIIKLSDDRYRVPSEKNNEELYDVNMTDGFCSCYVGCNGGPCKHQFAVMRKFGFPSWNFVPFNNRVARRFLYTLAVGANNIPEGWFASLHPELETASELSTTRREEAIPESEEVVPLADDNDHTEC